MGTLEAPVVSTVFIFFVALFSGFLFRKITGSRPEWPKTIAIAFGLAAGFSLAWILNTSGLLKYVIIAGAVAVSYGVAEISFSRRGTPDA